MSLWDKIVGRRVVNGDMTGRNNVGTISINGRSFVGNNVSMINGRVIVDGKDVTDQYDGGLKGIVEVRILEGVLQDLRTDAAVNAGNIAGNVHAGGSVNCDDVGGSINAGGSVNCDEVKGNINAGGSVCHG